MISRNLSIPMRGNRMFKTRRKIGRNHSTSPGPMSGYQPVPDPHCFLHLNRVRIWLKISVIEMKIDESHIIVPFWIPSVMFAAQCALSKGIFLLCAFPMSLKSQLGC
jgi:hypothetical protein